MARTAEGVHGIIELGGELIVRSIDAGGQHSGQQAGGGGEQGRGGGAETDTCTCRCIIMKERRKRHYTAVVLWPQNNGSIQQVRDTKRRKITSKERAAQREGAIHAVCKPPDSMGKYKV